MSATTQARPPAGSHQSNSGQFVSPPASRLRIARAWQQPKFLVGAALVVASIVIGALIVGGADQRVLVWSAARDLGAGTAITSEDLVASAVRVDGVEQYVGADSDDIVGRTLGRAVGAGELVAVSAIGVGRADMRLVTIPVEPIHAPADLAHGDIVDVYVSPRDAASSGGTSRLALPDVVVSQVAPEADSATGEIAVVLEVAAAQANAVVTASRSGVLDLVRVPVGSQ